MLNAASPVSAADPAPPGVLPDAGDGGWAALEAELDCWRHAGRTASFWWRDDDAVRPTPSLGRLLSLARRHGVPLSLAVIPAFADSALAEEVAASPGVTVLQHGWRHDNHAAPGAKRAELGDGRDPARALAELAEGRARLAALFGPRMLPVLVPPWNRIAAGLAARLDEAGLQRLSAFGPRPAQARPFRQNTHADILDWRGTRGFVGTAPALAAVLRHLEARRTGRADAAEATGLLTHHLVHDEACWAFLDRFLAQTARHPASAWPPPSLLFGLA